MMWVQLVFQQNLHLSDIPLEIQSFEKNLPSNLLFLTGDVLQHLHLQAVIRVLASCHSAVFFSPDLLCESLHRGMVTGLALLLLVALVFN